MKRQWHLIKKYNDLYSKRWWLCVHDRKRERKKEGERERERERGVGLLWLTPDCDTHIQSPASQPSYTVAWYRAISQPGDRSPKWLTCLLCWLPTSTYWTVESKTYILFWRWHVFSSGALFLPAWFTHAICMVFPRFFVYLKTWVHILFWNLQLTWPIMGQYVTGLDSNCTLVLSSFLMSFALWQDT